MRYSHNFAINDFFQHYTYYFTLSSDVGLNTFLSRTLDLTQASDRFYDETSIDSIRLNRFGLEVGEDNDFNSTNTEIVLETPENAEFLQV